MRYLLPLGGITDERFGILTTPSHKGIPAGIKAGLEWAADNEAFSGKFNLDLFIPWLASMSDFRSTCLFVCCPDVIGKAAETLQLFDQLCEKIRPWPVAFVAQDGQEDRPLPDVNRWETLFVGGTNSFKDSQAAASVIQQAQRLDKQIHIGRVNTWRRYSHFVALERYPHEFTCDGNYSRYAGKDNAIALFLSYMERARLQRRFSLPDLNCDR